MTLPRRPRPLAQSLARLSSAAAIYAALQMAGGTSAEAATLAWDGGGGADNAWSTGTNWAGDAVPAVTDDVVFGTAGAGVVDFGPFVSQATNSVQFTLSGFTLGTVPGANVLTVSSGNITVDSGVTATINATIDTGINNFQKLGSGTLTLNGTNPIIGGNTIVAGGELRLGTNVSLGFGQVQLGTATSGDVTLNFGGDTGGVHFNNINVFAGTGTRRIVGSQTTGSHALSGNLQVDAPVTIEVQNAGTSLNFQGSVLLNNLTGSQNTLTVTGAGDTIFSGFGLTDSAQTVILKTGTGALRVTSSFNSLSGTVDVREGSVIAGGTGSLGTATLKVGATTGVANAAILANGGVLMDQAISLQGTNANGTATIGNAAAGSTPTDETAFTGPINLNNRNVTLTAEKLGVAHFSGPINGTATTSLNVTGEGTVKLSGSAASALSTYGAINVTGSTLQYDVTGTGSLALNQSVTVNGGNLRATGGVLDFGNTVIETAAPNMVAGLREGFVGYNNSSSSFDEFSAAPTIGIRSGPAQANVSGSNQNLTQIIDKGWIENATYVYRGKINVPASGLISFGEAFDDNVSIRIDGVQVLRNTQWNIPTTTGTLALTPGLHDIEIRLGNGVTGYGANGSGDNGLNGWPGSPAIGIGYSDIGAATPERINFVDPSTVAGLFVTNANYSTLIVDAGSTMKAGGFNNTGAIQLYGVPGSGSNFTLNDAAAPRVNSVETLALSPNVANPNPAQVIPGTFQVGANQTVNIGALSLGPNTNLTITQAPSGITTVGGSGIAGAFGANSQLTVPSGTVNFNGAAALGSGVRLNVGSSTINISEDQVLGGLSSITPGTNEGTVTTAAGKTLTVNAGIYSGALNVGGNLAKNAAGIFTLDGKAAVTGNTTVSAGTLRLSNTAGGAGASTFGTAPVADTGGVIAVAVNPATGASGLGSSSVSLNGGTLRIGPDATGLTAGAAGLTGHYFNSGQSSNNTFESNFYGTPTATRIDSQINFTDLVQVTQRPVGVNPTNISIMWSGFIKIDQGGLYTFSNTSDDGTVVLIDGVPVVVNDGSHGAPGPAPTGQIYLEPGLHTIHNRFVQGGGAASVIMSYTGPDTGEVQQIVPASALSQGSTAVTFSNGVNVSDFANSFLDASGADVTVTGPITLGSGSTLNLGSSTYQNLVLNGAINYAGGAFGATVQIPATSAALPTAGFSPTISGNIGFDVANGSEAIDLTLAFPLRGTANLTKTNAGTLLLSGANSFTGTINLNGGFVAAASDANFGDSANPIIFNGGGIKSVAPLFLSRSMTVNSGGASFDTDADITVLSQIGGTGGGLTKLGPGTLNLPAGSTFGAVGQKVSIKGGVIAIGADSALGNFANAVELDGGALRTTASITTGRAISVAAGNGTLDVAGAANTLTVQSAITGTGALTKSGSGTLRSTVTAGTPFGGGALNLNGGTLALVPNSGAAAVALTGGAFTYGGTGTMVLDRNGNNSLTFTAATLARSGSGILTIAPASGTSGLGSTERLIVTGGVPVSNGMVSASILGRNADGSGDFLTYSAPNGFQVATYTNGFNSGSALEIANVNNVSLAGNETAFAVRAAGTIGLGTNTLAIGSGTAPAGLILNGASFEGGTISFGGAEPIVYTGSGSNLISSAITGTNGLTKVGPGSLTLAGNLNGLSGGVTVREGSIGANVSTGVNPFGSQKVTLGGGTLTLNPTASTAVGGLFGTYVDGNQGGVTTARNYDPSAYAPGKFATRVEPGLNFVFADQGAIQPAGYQGGNPGIGVGSDGSATTTDVNNWGAQFVGQINIAEGGLQPFGLSSDDGSRLYIDGQLVIENNGGQGGSYTYTNLVNLTPGLHEIRVEMAQGTGGANVRLSTPYGLTTTGLSLLDPIIMGNDIDVTADSSIDLSGQAFTRVGVGTISLTGGSTLTVNGDAGKTLQIGNLTGVGTGAVTINTNANVNPGLVTLPSRTLIKEGAGRLTLDNTGGLSGNNNLSGGSIEVRAGRLVAIGSSVGGSANPLDTATVTLNGGALQLDSKVGSMTFDNNVAVVKDSTIEAVPANLTLTLGSAARTMTISNGSTLTIDSYAGSQGMPGAPVTSIGNTIGANLLIASQLIGDGDIFKTSSTFGAANGPTINRNFGQLTLTGNSPSFSGDITVDRGILQANATTGGAKPLGTGAINLVLQPFSVGGIGAGSNNLQANSNINDPARTAIATALYLKSNPTNDFGNVVNLQGTGTEARFDVNNAGSGANNTITMGALNIAAAPNLRTLHVTGANNYTLAFSGSSPLTLPHDTTVVTTGGNLLLPMNVNATAKTLTKRGNATLTLGGTNTFGAVDIVNGNLAITSNAAVGGVSAITINGGALTLAGSASNAAGTLPIVVGPTAGLRFDNTDQVVDRWGDAAPVRINSGFFELIGNGATATSETVGTLTFSGNAQVRSQRGGIGVTNTLTLGGLQRLNNGTLQLNTTTAGTLGGDAQILISGTAPVNTAVNVDDIFAQDQMTSAFIISANDSRFVQYDPTLGFRPTQFSSRLLGENATDVINVAASTSLTNNATVYALRQGNATLSSGGASANTVTIRSGGLILDFTTNNQTSNVNYVFGESQATPGEGIIYNHNQWTIFSGKLTANNLTVFGNGGNVVVLSGDNSRTVAGGSGLEGVITINNGSGFSLRQTTTGTAPAGTIHASGSFGTGGSGAAGSNTTSIALAGGLLEGRFDGSLNVGSGFSAAGSGSLVPVKVIADSRLDMNRTGTQTSQTAHFGALTIEKDVTLTATGGNTYRSQFNGGVSLGGGRITLNTVSSDIFTTGAISETAPTTLVKAGAGRLEMSADSVSLSGPTLIQGGILQWNLNLNGANPVVAQDVAWGGTAASPALISLEGPLGLGSSFRVRVDGSNDASGVTNSITRVMNSFEIAKGTTAQIYGYQAVNRINNANPTRVPRIEFAGSIALGGALYIGDDSTAMLGQNPLYSGTITLDQSEAGERILGFTTGVGGRQVEVTGGIQDGPGTAGNGLTLIARNGVLNINGPAAGMTYSGGTTILQSDAPHIVNVAAGSKLGTGDVTVLGGQLKLNSASNIESGKKVLVQRYAAGAGLLTLAFDADPTSFIDPASQGVLALEAPDNTWDTPLNQATLGKLFLGAHQAAKTYTPTTLGVGADGAYRLGGGYNTLTISNSAGNILTGATNRLLVGQAFTNGGGTLTLNGSNDFGGGTVVDYGTGTFNVTGVNGLGSGSLTVNSGTVNINQSQSINGDVVITGGTVNVNVPNALGANPTVRLGVGSGSTSAGTLGFGSASQDFAGTIRLTGNGYVRPNVTTTLSGVLDFGSGHTLNVSGQNLLILANSALQGSGNINVIASPSGRFVNTALTFDDWSRIGPGNLRLQGGVVIVDGADGLGGRTFGPGPGQIELAVQNVNGNGTNTANNFNGTYFVGGGFAARTNSLTITNAMAGSSSTFDINFALGSAVTQTGSTSFYANAPVDLAADIFLTDRRVVSLATTGPGLAKATNDASMVINEMSGNLSGSGALIFRSNQNGNDGQIGEVVLSGTSTWTGSAVEDIDGGGAVRWVSAGPGGLILSPGPSNPVENGDVFVRFDGQSSLPSGNGGATAYILANRYSSSGFPAFRTGVLFTGDADGETYRLNDGYKLVLNGGAGTGSPLGATFGSAGGAATLRDTQIALIGGVQGGTANAATSALLVREGSLTLGDGTGPVTFQPANWDIPNANNAEPTITSAATGLIANTGARTIQVRGSGTAILSNVQYRTSANTGDTSGSFTWQLGPGIANVVEGFLRETNGLSPLSSLSNVRVRTAGGVLEIGDNPRVLSLGTGIGQIDMAGTGGGGFAAFGGVRTVNFGASVSFGAGNFVGNGQSLIFGSPTADNTVEFASDINMINGTQTIRTVNGVGGAIEGRITGAISNGSLVIDGALTSGGVLLPAGELEVVHINNTYTGTTTVNAGTLRVTGSIAASSLTTINGGATLKGNGTVGNVVINMGGSVEPGVSEGILNVIGAFTMNTGSLLKLELGGMTPGTQYDQVNVQGSVSLLSNITLSLTGGFSPQEGDIFYIILNDGPDAVLNTFAGLPQGSDFTIGTQPFRVSYTAEAGSGFVGAGNDVAIMAVPEPGSAVIVLAGLGSLVGLQRFRRRRM